MKKSAITTAILAVAIVLCGCVMPTPVPTRSPISPLQTSVALARPTATPRPTPVPPIVVDGNLLTNPSFELPYKPQGGVQEVNVALGWWAWYKDVPPCNPKYSGCWIPCPDNCIGIHRNCVNDYGCYWARPEFVPMSFDNAPYRVNSGLTAQKYFSYGRMHDAGLYQRVVTDAIQTGDLLIFAVYVQAWQCFSYPGCDGGRRSDLPYQMNIQVGIDPTGGTNPDSINIVWSGKVESFDKYSRLVASAWANGNAVSVWVRTSARFDFARANNDAYADDASLVSMSGFTPTVFLPNVTR